LLLTQCQGLAIELPAELRRGVSHAFFAVGDDLAGTGLIDRASHLFQQHIQVRSQRGLQVLACDLAIHVLLLVPGS
jgi:lipopolysaccharide biosynthesis regulator YciM